MQRRRPCPFGGGAVFLSAAYLPGPLMPGAFEADAPFSPLPGRRAFFAGKNSFGQARAYRLGPLPDPPLPNCSALCAQKTRPLLLPKSGRVFSFLIGRWFFGWERIYSATKTFTSRNSHRERLCGSRTRSNAFLQQSISGRPPAQIWQAMEWPCSCAAKAASITLITRSACAGLTISSAVPFITPRILR